MISQRPSLVYGFKKAILTPNAVEFARLSNGQDIQSLARQFGGVTIIQKSQVDLISNGECLVEGTLIASPRRCGGQGDVLAGSLATFACWAFRKDAPSFDCYSPSVVACYGATYLLRNCAIRAFDKYHRSTTTVEMISEIGRVFYETFEEQPKL